MDIRSEDKERLEKLKKNLSKLDEKNNSSKQPRKRISSNRFGKIYYEESENRNEKYKLEGPKIVGKIDLHELNKKFSKRIDEKKRMPNLENFDSGRTNTFIDYQRFEPIPAIGELKFFDYNVNKFGIIKDVKNEKNIQAAQVHVLEIDLATSNRIFEGEIVSFILNKHKRGFYATEVKPINELTLENLPNNIDFIDIKQIEKIISNSVGSNFHLIDPEIKNKIINTLTKKKDYESWVLFNKVETNESLIENFIQENIAPLSDGEKIAFLRAKYNDKLLENILTNWKSSDKILVLLLTETIGNNTIDEEMVSNGFINCFIINDWTYEELLNLFSVFKIGIIKEKVLSNFSFKRYNSIEFLKKIVPINELTIQIANNLTSRLIVESSEISIQTIFQIFTALKEYSILKNGNHLLELLSVRKLDHDEIKDLISLLSSGITPVLFRKTISNSIDNIYSWELNELLDICSKKTSLAS